MGLQEKISHAKPLKLFQRLNMEVFHASVMRDEVLASDKKTKETLAFERAQWDYRYNFMFEHPKILEPLLLSATAFET